MMEHPLLDRIDRKRLSPMMRQYVEIKEANPDCLLFFRLGDFYELFFDDALIASKALEIALTARDCGQEEKAPMCGVPYHAVETYLARLIEQGFKVAICEQMEDPSTAKGIVRREICRIVTPGTVTAPESLDAGANNFLVALYTQDPYYALAWIDITTYELKVSSFVLGKTLEQVLDEIRRLQPAEILCSSTFSESPTALDLLRDGFVLSPVPEESFFPKSQYEAYSPDQAEHRELCQKALNALLCYVEQTQRGLPQGLQKAQYWEARQYLFLDASARRHLELSQNLQQGGKKASLLGVLDRTETAMGSRFLRQMLEQPLLQKAAIEERLDAVEELKEGFILRQEMKELLRGIQDMERLSTKMLNRSAHPRDLAGLLQSLLKLPSLAACLQRCRSELLLEQAKQFLLFEEIARLLQTALVDQPPLSPKEGGVIREGYHEDCDQLRKASLEGRSWILELEQKERNETGIKNLKIGYNRVFGYYFEVSKGNLSLVPERFIRKQTLANGERFITEDLKRLEEMVLGAQQKLLQLEYQLFVELRERVAQEGEALLAMARRIAYVDSLCSLAEVADRQHYCRPALFEDQRVFIEEGRHPVVESFLPEGEFIPNDLQMDGEKGRLILLTGPNMAGKSTYMRQVALLVIMAQMGSFVPAKRAEVGIFDAVFTRIGASDDVASGQSTFMVEMKEVASILQRASSQSLLILDEIGRGTSTYDGLSIATAVIEYLAQDYGLCARTLFATHYHELVELEETWPAIANYHVSVSRQRDEVIFLHRIVPGGTDDSFGIEVAKMAGVPDRVVTRAREILRLLEKNNAGKTRLKFRKDLPMEGQLSLTHALQDVEERQAILDQLQQLDIQLMTPLDAFHTLHRLSEEAKRIAKRK